MVNLRKIKLKFNMNDKIVYFCAFALTVLVLFVCYVNFLSPMVTDLSAVLFQKADLENQLETKIHNLNTMDENISLASELQKSAAPRQIAASDETSAIIYFMRLIDHCSLTETNFKILPREYTSEDRFLRPLQVDVFGSYGDCMRFLYNIQHGEYYSLPDKIEMNTQDSDGSKVYMSLHAYLIVENDGFGSAPDESEESAESFTDTAKDNTGDEKNVRNPFFYAG